MRGNNKQSIPQSKKYVVIPKKKFKKFLESQVRQTRDVFSIRKNMRGIIGEEVEKYMKSYMSRVEHIIKEYSIWRELLIKKGLLTRHEINKELKK